MVSLNERRWLVLIFSLSALLAFGYSLLMPIWEAPDEPAHYHIAWYLARRDLYPTLKHNYEASQPRIYYYTASLVIRALNQISPRVSNYFLPFEHKQNLRKPEPRFDWNSDNYRFLLGVYLLRWINMILGALALWANWKAFQVIAPDKPVLRLAALALAALTPQYLHIMSSVSNDALGTVAGALLFYLTVRVLKEQSKILHFITVFFALVLPLTTKLTVLPVSMASLIIIMWKWVPNSRSKRWWVVSGLAILSGIGILYFLFPNASQLATHEIDWRLFNFRKNAFTNQYLTFILSQIIWTFWGKVGWIAIGLPAWIVNLLTVAWFIGVSTNAAFLLKTKRSFPHFRLWIATWLIAIITIAAVIRNGLTTSASQGRFLFPAIGALFILMISGWHDVLPAQFQRFLPMMIILFMVSINILLCVTGIIPTYFQPFWD
jgi:hypothetical protein